MRRTIEQAQAEIMQNKARHDAAAENRRRIVRTAVIPALSAAAVFALVFGFAILPLLKSPGAQAPGEHDAYADLATPAPAVNGNVESEAGDGLDTESANLNATNEPDMRSEGEDLPTSAEPGPWICGTPILQGGFYEPGNAATYGETPDGGVLVLWDGDEKVNFYLDAETAARMYRCIMQLEPLPGAEMPDDSLAEYVISLDFGNKSLRCISYSDGSFLINQDRVCTASADTAQELARLVDEARE